MEKFETSHDVVITFYGCPPLLKEKSGFETHWKAMGKSQEYVPVKNNLPRSTSHLRVMLLAAGR